MTDQPTNWLTDRPNYRVACTGLERAYNLENSDIRHIKQKTNETDKAQKYIEVILLEAIALSLPGSDEM